MKWWAVSAQDLEPAGTQEHQDRAASSSRGRHDRLDLLQLELISRSPLAFRDLLLALGEDDDSSKTQRYFEAIHDSGTLEVEELPDVAF